MAQQMAIALSKKTRQTHELQKLPKNKDANKKQEKVKKT